MQIEVKVPSVGESITEGLLAEWLRKDGDVVRTDDPLYVLETDKVTMTVNAEHTGQLKIAVAAGEPVKIGQAVATLDTSVQAPAAAPPRTEPETRGAGEPAVKMEPESRGAGEPGKEEVPQTPGPAMHPVAGMPTLKAHLAAAQSDDDFPPSVRRMLEEYRLDPGAIQGTGRGGRLTKEDVVAFLAKARSTEGGAAQGTEPESRGAGEPARPKENIQERAPEERQTRKMMTPIRSRIAERMLISQQSTATLTTFNEADLGALVDLRKRYREAFKARHGADLTYLPFFVKAVSDALDAVPDLASWIEGAEVVTNHHRDIGIAVAAEQGLAVPVLRDVDRKTIPEIQLEIEGVARKVREKRITLDDLKGAVFSITNAGSYGALMGTPILNPPQSGILGMYTIQERPVARDSQVVIRPMMYLALSYDHRVVDGKAAGTFLKLVAESVANPARMLLDI